MKTSTLLATTFAAATLLAIASPALAQHHAGQPPPAFVPKDHPTEEHHRRGEVGEYGAATKVPEHPFPWRAVALGVLLCLVAAPGAMMVYRSTSKDLQDMKTVGRNSGDLNAEGKEIADGKPARGGRAAAAAAAAAAGPSARDKVLEAVHSVDQWVPVDWVAKTAGVSVDDASDELYALAQDGELESNTDRSGNAIYKAVAG